MDFQVALAGEVCQCYFFRIGYEHTKMACAHVHIMGSDHVREDRLGTVAAAGAADVDDLLHDGRRAQDDDGLVENL